MNIRARVITLGCRVNQYESDAIMWELSQNGIEIARDNEPSDIVVINTCSVTSESDRKSRQQIRRAISLNPNAVVIVTGCYSQINPQRALNIPGVSFVCGNNGKSVIAKKALELLKEKNRTPFAYMPDIYEGKFDVMTAHAPLTRTRAFVKIQDGCESKCAYCIIPYARGNVRSNAPENVINEIKAIVANGSREVVLTGIETAAYGRDFKNGYGLGDLLTETNKIEGLSRIRLGSLDPSAITKDFVDKIKALDKVMPHFHISMQSGSTRILNLMRRKYNMDMARRNIQYLRECIPCNLSADIITGFPGESDADFEETMEFFKGEEFLHIHIFPYSKREGTPAATMPNQVSDEIKKARLHMLEKIEADTKNSIYNRIISAAQPVEILFETFDGEFAYGHTRDFIEIKAKSSAPLGGQILSATPIGIDGAYLLCEI